MENRSSKLRQLSGATGVFQTYQSHNAVFNAIHQLKLDPNGEHQVRLFQMYNYELGLQAIEDVLEDGKKKGIPPAVYAYDQQPVDTKMETVQKRLETLQVGLAEAKRQVEASIRNSQRKYLWWYIGLSTVSIVGAACKVIDKIAG